MVWTTTDLGLFAGGTHTVATAASADGSVIVGYGDTAAGARAFRWTAATGLVSLGVLAVGSTLSAATGVSADGSVVVGYGDNATGNGLGIPFRWTAATGLQALPVLPGASYSTPSGISADGLTIIGHGPVLPPATPPPPDHFWTWTQAGGMVDHGIPAGNIVGITGALSSDGSVAVGGGTSLDHAWRWTSAGGFLNLGFIGTSTTTFANAVSADGSHLAGQTAYLDTQAWRWNATDGMIGLGFLVGGTTSAAMAISGDGTIISGYGDVGGQIYPFVWTQAAGMVGLDQLTLGNDSYVTGMSSNGLVLVGYQMVGGQQRAGFWTNGSPTPPPTPPPPAAIPVLPQSLGLYRGLCGINWYGKTLFGDAFSGVIGEANFDTATEYGHVLQAMVTSPPIHSNRRRVFIGRFELDIESGVGLVDGQGSDPQWMLQWSKDGGRTWSSQQLWRSMGRTGEYQKRLRWLKLGESRQWIFRLVATDPVRRTIIGVYVDRREGMA